MYPSLQVEDHVDTSANSSPRTSKSNRTSQSPLDHRRGGRGSSEDHRFEALPAVEPKESSSGSRGGEDRHRTSRSVDNVEVGRLQQQQHERESSIVSNSGEEEESSPHHRSSGNGSSRSTVD